MLQLLLQGFPRVGERSLLVRPLIGRIGPTASRPRRRSTRSRRRRRGSRAASPPSADARPPGSAFASEAPVGTARAGGHPGSESPSPRTSRRRDRARWSAVRTRRSAAHGRCRCRSLQPSVEPAHELGVQTDVRPRQRRLRRGVRPRTDRAGEPARGTGGTSGTRCSCIRRPIRPRSSSWRPRCLRSTRGPNPGASTHRAAGARSTGAPTAPAHRHDGPIPRAIPHPNLRDGGSAFIATM